MRPADKYCHPNSFFHTPHHNGRHVTICRFCRVPIRRATNGVYWATHYTWIIVEEEI